MNNKTIDYKKEYQTIEELAQMIKFGNISKVKQERLKNEIMKHIFVVKGLSFYNELGENTLGKTLEESKSNGSYSGLIYYKTYKDVLKAYGMEDKETGELIPFMKLFNNLVNLRKNSIVKEKVEEQDYFNAKAKEERMNTLLRKSLKSKEEKNRFNVLNLDKVLQTMKEHKCSKEELEQAQYIMENSLVCTDYIASQDDPENGTWLSDTASVYRFEDSENAIERLTKGIDKAINSTSNKTVKKYILYYTNMKLISYVPTEGTAFELQLEPYRDKKLQKYLQGAEIDDEVQVLANYLNQERETVRKNLRKAKLAIMMAA